MGAVDTTYTFTATDTITSAKMNNIIDQTTMTSSAIIGTTLEVASGQLKVRSQGITSNEMGTSSVTTDAIADGAVTQAKASNMLVPSGAIMAFAMNSAPTGWLAANGASISTGGANAALFSAIGYTYGGSGGSFNLPDIRGYFVRGHGLNADGTTSNSAFGEKKADTFKAHTHGFVNGRSYLVPSTTSGNGREFGSGAVDTLVNFDAGSGTETAPRNISMLYCIKL